MPSSSEPGARAPTCGPARAGPPADGVGPPAGGGPSGATQWRRWASATGALIALLSAGCSDAPDWRGVQPEGWRLKASMPCRPTQHSRALELTGRALDWSLWTCEVGGYRFALGSGDVGDPGAVPAVLRALPAAAAANLGAKIEILGPAAVPGMTPSADAVRYSIQGRDAQGAAHSVTGVVFAHGTRVYQAMVMGAQAAGDLAVPLFEALKVEAL